MEIIPAIDIIDGKCVRLTQGDYSQKKEYSSDPVAMARQFEDAGIRRLHLVDLDGAKQKRIINHKVLEQVASQTQLHIDFGGGVQSDEDLQKAFDCGAKQVTGGSIAVKNPQLFESWLAKFGSEKIILGADAKDRKIAVSGWQESTETDLLDFLKEYQKKSVKYTICTDVAKDGLLQGPSVDLYREILQEIPDLCLIASGGVSSLDDLKALQKINVYGVIIGKAIYEGRVTLKELQQFV